MIIGKSRRQVRCPNRIMNRVWIGLYQNCVAGTKGRKVWKGAKGIMGLWGAQKREQPFLNMLIAHPDSMVFTNGDVWTW